MYNLNRKDYFCLRNMLEAIDKIKQYSFLQNLEQMNLLRIVSRKNARQGSKKQKLSERFAGALKLTDEQYRNMQTELTQMRNE